MFAQTCGAGTHAEDGTDQLWADTGVSSSPAADPRGRLHPVSGAQGEVCEPWAASTPGNL